MSEKKIGENSPKGKAVGMYLQIDWFECNDSSCKYSIQALIYGDHPLCPMCGRWMNRCKSIE